MDASIRAEELTLRTAFVDYYLSKLVERERSVATIGNYRQAMGVYERFARDLANELLGPLMGRPVAAWAEPILAAAGPRLRIAGAGTGSVTTGSQPKPGQAEADPANLPPALVGRRWDLLSAIDDASLKAFSRWLIASHYSATTHNKHLNSLLSILRSLGPREKGNPEGSGILAQVPHARLLPTGQSRRRLLTADQLTGLYQAAAAMTWPADTSVGAPLLWQAYLVILYTHGFRVEDGRALRWQHVHFEALSPDANSIAESPHGWIEFTSTKTGRPQVLPMNASLRAHLAAIQARCRHLPSDLVIDMRGRKQTRCGAWTELSESAGVEADLSDLRKTCNTAHRRACSALRLSHLVPGLFLGHAPRGVNEQFYTREDQDMVASVNALAWQPEVEP